MAPTPSAPASSAWSSCWARAPSGPAYDGSRPLVGGDAYRFLAREHLLVGAAQRALKARPEELPERVDDIVERLRAAEKEIEKVRRPAAAGVRGRPGRARRGPRRGVVRGPRGRTAPVVATYAPWRSTSATGCRPSAPAWRRSSAPRAASPRSWSRSTTPARAPGSRPTRWSASPPRCSAAGAAARTTWPRAAAPTPSRADEALAAIRRTLADGR